MKLNKGIHFFMYYSLVIAFLLFTWFIVDKAKIISGKTAYCIATGVILIVSGLWGNMINVSFSRFWVKEYEIPNNLSILVGSFFLIVSFNL